MKEELGMAQEEMARVKPLRFREGGACYCVICRGEHKAGYCKAEPRTAIPESIFGKAVSETRNEIRDSFTPHPIDWNKAVDPKGEAGKQKTQLALIPTALNKSVAGVLRHGAEKYGIFNWRATSVCASTYVHAMMRHLDAYRDGEDADKDSGLSHLAHIAANCAILLDAESCSCLADDRYKKTNNSK